MKKNDTVRLTANRDIPILRFVWRWKLVPTDYIHARFFNSTSRRVCFNRLATLRRAGYLETVFVPEQNLFAWTLKNKGFHQLKDYLPQNVECGFKSESPNHDLLTLMLNLGDGKTDVSYDNSIFTEQELRRFPICFYPKWVPINLKHRADGYVNVRGLNKQTTYALELELSPKSISEYETIGLDYANNNIVSHILWATTTVSFGASLHRILSPFRREGRELHSIVLLDALRQHEWGAIISLGPLKGLSLRNLFAHGDPMPQQHDGP